MFTLQKNLSVDELQTELQKKRQLYQNCDELNQQIGKMVEAGDGVQGLKLLKRREVIFHQIREADRRMRETDDNSEHLRWLSQQTPVITELYHQIQELIQKITLADGHLLERMTAKRTEVLKALSQNHHHQRLATAYRSARVDSPHFIDAGQ